MEQDNTKQHGEQALRGLTLRSFVVAVVFLYVSALWLRRSELVTHSCQVGESVPPIPALAFLVLLALASPLVGRVCRWLALTRAEALVVFCILAIAVPMGSLGVSRIFLAFITVPFYFASPENGFDKIQAYLPQWIVPRDFETIRQMYEGTDTGIVPWGQWLPSLGIWLVFFTILWLTLLCLNAVLRKQWVERERLNFSIAELPVAITAREEGRIVPDFFRNRYMWLGFFLAFAYNMNNIIHALNPSFAALGKSFDVGALFTERPWDAVRPMIMHYRPELIAFGFLAPTELCFSTWFFYVANRALKVFASMRGWQQPEIPYEQEQCGGAYLGAALLLLWVARRHLWGALGTALGQGGVDESREPLRYRYAFLGLAFGAAALLAWWRTMGLPLWMGAVYLAILLAIVLTYNRVRAEIGVPNILVFPFYQHKRMLLNAFGVERFAPGGDFRGLTILSLFSFIGGSEDAWFPVLSAYQMEAFKLSDSARIRRGDIVGAVVVAMFLGLIFGWAMHLITYYDYGANVLEGGTTEGGYRTTLAVREYTALAANMESPEGPNMAKTSATVAGTFVAVGLWLVRNVWFKFPLHPLGYAIATAYGRLIWGSFLIAWVAKVAVLRLGGSGLYRRLIPAAYGLAMGHYFTAGVLWGTFGIYFGEAYRRYGVWFA